VNLAFAGMIAITSWMSRCSHKRFISGSAARMSCQF
jgi:hypothetical protein